MNFFRKIFRKIRYTPDYEKILLTLRLDTDPWKLISLKTICNQLDPHVERYQRVSQITGVPEWVIAGLQYRENSVAYPNFQANMVNGQPIHVRTTLVPKGLGPWETWEDSCIEAFARRKYNRNWSVAEWLEFCEKYNGIGNRYYGQESTYVLGFTNHSDERGRYVGDGQYSNTSEDKRPGVAAIYLYMLQNKRTFFKPRVGLS